MTRKYKVLFLCRENSARSIIAEALLRELASHRFDAFSAGPEPAARVHPLAIAQLRPGISDLGVLCPKSWLEFTGEWAPRMDLVIAMDDGVAGEHAPGFPGDPALCNWSFANPLADDLSDAERLRSFEKVFWQIVRQVSAFIDLPQYAVARRDSAKAIEVPLLGKERCIESDAQPGGASMGGTARNTTSCRV
ncbi:arsenate reductase [Paraburkholderia sp. GAS199]|uniref:arsenate reductase ArsC n=1 Tax=Paraburkholderia sp. GAS199 TaxID=3035126 RepID=UPI003D25DB91